MTCFILSSLSLSREKLGTMGLKVQEGHKDHVVRMECQDLLERRDFKDPQGVMVPKEKKEPQYVFFHCLIIRSSFCI